MSTSIPGESVSSEYLIEPDRLRQLIIESDDLAMEAIEMANDPDCVTADFVAVIEKDAGLVTDILSLSNSPMYQASREINGIQHAVMVVGFSQCQNLIVSSSMKSLAKKLPPSVEWARDVLWRHSSHTATIARALNKHFKLGFDGEEFSGAMVHDVGRLLIAAAAPDVFEVVDRLTFRESVEHLEIEQGLIGTDHSEIGAWFAEAGHLPHKLVDIIRHHHNPLAAESNRELVALVSAADHMANHIMHMGRVDGYEPTGNLGLQVIVGEGVTSESQQQIVESIMRVAEEAIDSLPTGI